MLTMSDAGPARYAVVIGIGDSRRAILTQRVCGETEIASRPLPEAMRPPPFVTGAAELNTGTPAVIVRPEGILHRISAPIDDYVPPPRATTCVGDEAIAWTQGKPLRVLLCRSGDEILAVPLAALAEIVAARPVTYVPALGKSWRGLLFVRGLCHALAKTCPDSEAAGDTIKDLITLKHPERCALGTSEVIGDTAVPYQKAEFETESGTTGPLSTLCRFNHLGMEARVMDVGGALSAVLRGTLQS
jgi:hypothetical protein